MFSLAALDQMATAKTDERRRGRVQSVANQSRVRASSAVAAAMRERWAPSDALPDPVVPEATTGHCV